MSDPGRRHRPRRGETCEPHLAPALAHDRGVGRPCRIAYLRDDRAQGCRGEAAPGVAKRVSVVDTGGAGDRLDGIVGILGGELVAIEPLGVPDPTHVETETGVSVTGEITMGGAVAERSHVALAVGNVLEHGGDWSR